ncbi:MAG: bifunctional phosphoribosyl-AMP cyclohydrolase/phosphoribosyl-ATP diphosphatase HisIE [Calditrichia bacterium]
MKLNFDKSNGLLPTIVQHAENGEVLMLGYMNREALEATQRTGRVTFYSRTRQRLWTKGETSGYFLYVDQILPDCDADTLLIKAKPEGPVCHTGNMTCFAGDQAPEWSFLSQLERVINKRKQSAGPESYTAELFARGIPRIAQKVGEEAVEMVLEAVGGSEERFLNEAADLLYHYLVLLSAREKGLSDVVKILEDRHSSK